MFSKVIVTLALILPCTAYSAQNYYDARDMYEFMESFHKQTCEDIAPYEKMKYQDKIKQANYWILVGRRQICEVFLNQFPNS